MKRGDLLRYGPDSSLWIVEWADDRWVKLAGITHAILIELSDLELISENR
jgi:hypothetical protein